MSQPKNKNRRRGVGFGLLAVLMATPMVTFYEGTRLQTYTDPVGIPTVCMGETDKELVMRESFTEQECTALLGASMTVHMMEVAKCVEVPVQAHEAAAIVSWSYNVGTHAACTSTLVRMLNEGAPPEQWCQQLTRWVYAGGKKLRGLEKRRQSELSMCLTGEWE